MSSSASSSARPSSSERQLRRVAEDLGVLELPPLEPLLLGVGLAVDLDEGEQLLEQAVARLLERLDGALEPLQEVRADQPDDLVLAVLLDRVDRSSSGPL